MLERKYQAQLIEKLKNLFPGCMILKNDTSYMQGIPDLTVLYGNTWAVLEVKASSTARSQLNQNYYVERLDNMSYAAFIYPENEEQVLRELQHIFGSRREACVSQPK